MSDPFLPGLLERLPEPPRRVALVRASRIGDFLCAVPAIRALRAAMPEAQISMITLPILRPLAERSPYLDRYLPFPGYPGIAEQFFEARRATDFFRQMQAEAFDLAIQLQGSGVNSNPFTLMLGARATAGFVRPGDPAGRLDAALPIPEQGHEIERVLALVEFLGAPRRGEELEFPLWEEDITEAGRLLSGARRPLVGLHPMARDRTRRWPLARFAAAGAELRKRYGGTLVLLGEAQAQPAASRLIELCGGPVLNLVGRTSLPVLGAVIAQLQVLVTNDTGPAHIAYAVGTPTVTVFGGGELERYRARQAGPFRMLAYPIACRPCSYEACPIEYLCLENVTVEEVVAASEAVKA